MLSSRPALGTKRTQNPSDDFVPRSALDLRARLRCALVVVGVVAPPIALWTAPVSDATVRTGYIVALAAILLVVLVGARRQASPRSWVGIAVGVAFVSGSALAQSRPYFLGSQPFARFDVAGGLRAAAYVVLIIAVLATLRERGMGVDRASTLDGLIVGCALSAVLWPLFAYPGVTSRAAGMATNSLTVTRPLLAITLCAVGVRLLFRRAAGPRLLCLGLFAIAASDLFVSSGLVQSSPRGRGVIETTTLVAVSLIAVSATRSARRGAPHLDVDPADRVRLLGILTLVSVSFAAPLAFAWSSGDRNVATLVSGACALVMFGLVAVRLWQLAAGARASGVRHGERRLGALVQGLSDAIFVVERSGMISYASPRAGALLGLDVEEIVGRRFDRCLSVQEAGRVGRQLDLAFHMRPGANEEVFGSYVDAKGRERDFEINIANRLEDRDVAGIVITMRDVTARRQLTLELEKRAFRDDLTKLANRALFLDRLEQARFRSQRSGTGIAVMFVDLDDFKAVNDGLGHAAGDALLCAVADRLSECLRPADTIARLGGDEFAVLLEDIVDAEQVNNAARRLLEVLQLPVNVGEMSVSVPASIGIAIASDGAARGNLMRDADIALYRAKEHGKNRFAVFDPAMGWEAYNRLQLRSQLETAVDDATLRVAFQPIVSLASSAIVGVEALVRWEHPTLGTLLPAEFIPIAEDSALITSIGGWVLTEACREAAAWNASGHDLYVSVNVSARQLREPEFADEVMRALEKSGLRADRLMLELTESVLIDEVAGQNLVDNVAPIGVGIAIDDFGTGYSSLAYLQRFPVHVVKIDRSFVSRLGDDGTRAVVKSMSAISEVMGYVSIAEGVETDAEAAELFGLDYGYAQGYLYSRPVDAAQITAMLDAAAAVLPAAP